MSNTMKEFLGKLLVRVKAAAWQALGLILAGGITYLSENITQLNIPEWATGLIGIIIIGATKWINNEWQIKNGAR